MMKCLQKITVSDVEKLYLQHREVSGKITHRRVDRLSHCGAGSFYVVTLSLLVIDSFVKYSQRIQFVEKENRLDKVKANDIRMNFVILVLCSILLTIFFREFTYAYMDYFDIGINYVTRLMDLDFCLTPLVIVVQIASVSVFDRFISRSKGKWRILLNVSALILSVILFFTFYALVPYGKGIPRQGGFIRFLGYYFLGLEPGRMPDGSW